MAADDPTPGELRIMISNVIGLLSDIKSEMATKEFVNAKFDAFLDRMNRLEQDHKDWVKSSTEAHVALDRDSKARHAETRAEMEALEVRLRAAMEKKAAEARAQIDEVVTEQKSAEKEVKAVRNSRVTQWIGIGLAWLGTVVLWFVDRGQA
jgi:uncharacterized protein (UPF0335 family)